jgi:hypothetical protein
MSQRELGESPRAATLGIVLLDCDHYVGQFGRFSPSDQRGLGCMPPGFFECPATWPVNTAYAVASGAKTLATLRGEKQAIEGLVRAIAMLEGSSDLIITDCGFFWTARLHAQEIVGTVLLSSLDLLDLAALLTPDPIGVLTFDAERAQLLLANHPAFHRLRIVGVNKKPSWRALESDNWVEMGGWTIDALRRDFVDVVEPQVRDGLLKDAGVIVLECTVFPQFRDALRRITQLPVLDAASMAKGILS